MRYVHTNLIARDWKALSAFYQKVFGCTPVSPQRDLQGEWVDRLTGLPGAHITGEHLRLPGWGDDGPTLEIFSYDNVQPQIAEINGRGFSHIAFEVEDVKKTLTLLQRHGGSLLGEVVCTDYGALGVGTFAYARDIEGNIIELQSWAKHG